MKKLCEQCASCGSRFGSSICILIETILSRLIRRAPDGVCKWFLRVHEVEHLVGALACVKEDFEAPKMTGGLLFCR